MDELAKSLEQKFQKQNPSVKWDKNRSGNRLLVQSVDRVSKKLSHVSEGLNEDIQEELMRDFERVTGTKAAKWDQDIYQDSHQ